MGRQHHCLKSAGRMIRAIQACDDIFNRRVARGMTDPRFEPEPIELIDEIVAHALIGGRSKWMRLVRDDAQVGNRAICIEPRERLLRNTRRQSPDRQPAGTADKKGGGTLANPWTHAFNGKRE
jgi:hypothetical protein